MQVRNTAERYGLVTIVLHWAVAGLVVTQFVLAEMAEEAEAAHSLMGQLAWLARHKSVGITILGLALLRVLWRLAGPTPAVPSSTPGWQRTAAVAAHWGLYALIFALPLSGWAMSSAANFSVSWFGLFTLPNLVSPDEALKGQLAEVHEVLATALFALAALHVAAALKHQFVDRDGVLARMLGLGGAR